jgi:PAS domain S-box-containing protein
VQAGADALRAFGFQRVVVSLRDASLTPTMVVTAGDTDRVDEIGNEMGHALKPLPGAVWRRRLVAIERFRDGELHILDGSDPWVAREFFGADALVRADDATWLPTDLVVALLHGAEEELLGIVEMMGSVDERRIGEAQQRDIASLTRHLAARLAYDALRGLAQQRASRLQRLQEAGASLARSLDEHEIVRELARQAMRATNADGVTIVEPDLVGDILVTSLCLHRGTERPRAPVRLGDGLIAEVARTGRSVRLGDREADRARARAGLPVPLSLYDVIGESGSAASVLAVPMLVGIQLVGVLAVHAVSTEVFDAEDEEVLATIASQAATAIANARRYGESERERRQTEALADVARAVSESLRLGEVLRLILRHAVALLGAEGACIALRKDEYMHIVAAVGAADVLAGVHLPVAGSLLGHSVTNNELVVSNDFRNDPQSSRTVNRLTPVQRTVIAPLITARGTVGSISVMNRDAPFTGDDSRVLQRLADHVAVAIVNARLFEEIERATREWKLAFDSIASGMVVLEDNLTVRRCNARAAELCGLTIPALLGKTLREALLGLSATGDASGVDALVQRALADGQSARATVRDEVRGRLFEVCSAPHPDGGCVLTFDDVTSVHRLAEQHRRVLETVSDAIIITSLEGQVTFANAAAHTLFKRATLVGESIETLTAPGSLEEVRKHERAALDGAHQLYECHVQRSSGEQRLVAISTAPQYELGKVTGTVACIRDISGNRADSLALARSEARYAQLVESASDAIFTVDLDGRFTSVSRGVLAESGLPREALIGAPCETIIDPRDRRMVATLLERTIRGERQRVELRYLAASGTSRLGLLTTDALLENGTVIGGLGVMRDTTDDTALREANAKRAHLESVGALLGSIANEINNPLNALLAMAEVEASSPRLPGQDRRTMEAIRDEARRASRVVSDVLERTHQRQVELVAASTTSPSLAEPESRAPPRSILIVEDEDSLRAIVGRFFVRQGYEVSVAPGGADALEQLQAREFGVVLLDLHMAGMSGEETYRKILRRHPGQADRVLFTTGDLHSTAAAEFVRATGRPILAKPFALADLERRVAELLLAL